MAGEHHYEIFIEPSARRTLAKLPHDINARLIRRIQMLGDNPRPSGAVKLSGHEAYRVRVGD